MRSRNWCFPALSPCGASTARPWLPRGPPVELIDHPDFVPVHGAIEGIDRFDPLPFGLSAGEAAEIDPQQRLLLELSSLALDDAACDVVEDGPVGVFVGTGFNSYLVDNLRGRLGFAGGFERYSVVVASGSDFAATRIAYKQGLTGPAVTVASACSTALSAVAAAVDSFAGGTVPRRLGRRSFARHVLAFRAYRVGRGDRLTDRRLPALRRCRRRLDGRCRRRPFRVETP